MVRRYFTVIGICSLLAFTAGCAGVDTKTEVKLPKKDYEALLQEKNSLASQLEEVESILQKEKASFETEKLALTEKMNTQKATYEKEIALYAERIDSLQRQSEGVKTILLFDGKVKYEVESSAIMDYEEAVIFKMLNDPEFKTNLEKGGSAADLSLIALLREISAGDRKITKKEVEEFRKKGAK